MQTAVYRIKLEAATMEAAMYMSYTDDQLVTILEAVRRAPYRTCTMTRRAVLRAIECEARKFDLTAVDVLMYADLLFGTRPMSSVEFLDELIIPYRTYRSSHGSWRKLPHRA